MLEERRDREDLREAQRSGSLARLKELDDYKVADGSEDIRGWDVRTRDGRKIGKVDELIIDTSALKARYIEVKVDKDVSGTDDDRWALVPIGTAQLNEREDDVIIDQLPTSRFLSKEERGREPLSREVELSLRETYGATTTGLAADAKLESEQEDEFYGDAIYDDRRLWESRRRDQRDRPYIARHPEDTERRI